MVTPRSMSTNISPRQSLGWEVTIIAERTVPPPSMVVSTTRPLT